MDIKKRIDEINDSVVAFRRVLHENPELGMKEFGTTKRIMEELASIPNIEAIDLETGVLAVLKGGKPGKTVAVRGDIDALPIEEESGLPFASKNKGVCHACGHDIHTAVILGCAKVLGPMASEISGTIKFFFQPAEEVLAGARHLIAKGVMENPKVDGAFCLHCSPLDPVGSLVVKKGPFMASADNLDIKVIGQSGHAGYPHRSIDSVVIAAQVINALQTIVSREIDPADSAVITLGTINGGSVRNIIAPSVTMTGTVRTVSVPVRNSMPERIERIVKRTAEAHGGSAEVTYIKGTPPVINDLAMLEHVLEAAATAVGEENIRHLEAPLMGGEDFAFFMEKVPSALFRVGTASDDPQTQLPLHNSKIRFDERSIAVGIEVMCRSALNFLNK